METLTLDSARSAPESLTKELEMADSLQDPFDSVLCVSDSRLVRSGIKEKDCKGVFFASFFCYFSD